MTQINKTKEEETSNKNDVKLNYQLGSKIYFSEEKRPYKIMACNDRFIVCNKPFNLQKTVFYTIVDLQEKIRGPEDLIFGLGAETIKECEDMLERVAFGDSQISYIHRADLNITKIVF